jgi:hypothetical protein
VGAGVRKSKQQIRSQALHDPSEALGRLQTVNKVPESGDNPVQERDVAPGAESACEIARGTGAQGDGTCVQEADPQGVVSPVREVAEKIEVYRNFHGNECPPAEGGARTRHGDFDDAVCCATGRCQDMVGGGAVDEDSIEGGRSAGDGYDVGTRLRDIIVEEPEVGGDFDGALGGSDGLA